MAQDNPRGEQETGQPSDTSEPTGTSTSSAGSGAADGATGDAGAGGAAGAAPDPGPNPWARPGSASAEHRPAEATTTEQRPTDPGAGEQHPASPAAADPAGPTAGARPPHPPYAGQGAPQTYGHYPYVPYPGAQQPYPGAPQYPGMPAVGADQPTAQHPAGPGVPSAAPPYPPGYGPGPAPAQGPTRRNRVLAVIAIGAVLALVAGGIGGAVGADIARSGGGDGGVLAGPLPDVDPDVPMTPVEQVAQRVLPSVVQLRVEGGALASGQLGEGSGMVVSPDGLVLTNNHVVEPAASGGTLRAVFQDGRTATVRIVGRDPESDIALVKADITGLTPVELGNSDGVRVGQQVTAFGSPLGLGGSVTTGIVSALNRAVSVGGDEGGATRPTASSTVLSALQTDAAINPGNSGGPLVDMQGRVIGINSAIATAGPGGGSIGVGFSIPVNQAKRIADQLRTTGKATHAILGVEVTDDPQQTGARLRTVTPDGAAARAGLKPGDLVVRFGDQQITTGTELQAAVRSQPPGAVVDVQLADRTVQVTLGEK
ncbi:S1C family serine protease [Pseudonocardia endophytica]|uniref:Putative serine protease PepD n=1 Tax=Pseudonocardia endophytica TaxID=401976 RepID=A0A4R1HYP9_PSEEN|nr:trypsin-like peptidase domain-containing protein [Pseudonocardia endophytica]TCK26693.1 putative serine protease PepD [Pseudonocardia endophytica]